jgi:tRNA(fMet)-specific endonuclease VapC
LILDTNALSAFVDGHAGVDTIVSRQPRAALPVIVLGEYRFGITASRHRREYEHWLDAQLHGFEVLDVTDATAVVYASVRASLRKLGRPIPANDLWIAALALQHGLPVLSRDAHYDVVDGLERRSW